MNKYDEIGECAEERKNIRNRAGMRAFILMSILIFVNAFVVEKRGHWGEPVVEALVIMYICTIYSITLIALSEVASHIYKSKKELYWGLVFLGLGILSISVFLVDLSDIGWGAFYKDGILRDNILPLFNGIFFIYIGLVQQIYTYLKSKKN